MELSSLLIRNVNYEIPSLKKQIAKCQQLRQEYSRKEEEGQAGAGEMREQFYHSCKQYGITVRREGPWGALCLPGPSSSAFVRGFLPSLAVPFLDPFLASLQSWDVLFNLLGSTSHHFYLSPPSSILSRETVSEENCWPW